MLLKGDPVQIAFFGFSKCSPVIEQNISYYFLT